MELQRAHGSGADQGSGSSRRRIFGCFRTKLHAALFVLAVVICVTIIVICIAVAVSASSSKGKLQETKFYIYVDGEKGETGSARRDGTWDPTYRPSSVNFYKYFYDYAYRFAGAACAEKPCSTVGTQMLAEGGSAIDALIAMSLCLGVYRTTSSGIGGGGFMTIYIKAEKKPYILDYRERAGIRANATMYENSTLDQLLGGGSIATPGEVAGLWTAHQRFGKLPWSRLFEPSIKMLEEGVIINDYVGGLLQRGGALMDDNLKAIFFHENGTMKKSGDTIKIPKLAETYRRIAEGGRDIYYNGTLLDDIVDDLQEIGDQVITREDLQQYEVTEREPLIGELRNGEYTMISPPPPSGGVVLQYIMKILDGYNLTKHTADCSADDEDIGLLHHRIVEAWKFAYASRSQLGDGEFVDNSQTLANITSTQFADTIRALITDDRTHEDMEYYGLTTDSRLTTGTSQASVIAANGDAAAFTTSINYLWGSKRMGSKTGIIFNDLMGDFSLPNKPSWTDDAWTAPSNKHNWIEPKKRPLSSMSPTIVLDKEGNVRLVTGGSGGSKIITATAMTMINNLWLGWDLNRATSEPRLHHQLLPPYVFYEEGFPEKYLDMLRAKGHEVKPNTFVPVSDSVSRENGIVYAYGDRRRQGGADGY